MTTRIKNKKPNNKRAYYFFLTKTRLLFGFCVSRSLKKFPTLIVKIITIKVLVVFKNLLIELKETEEKAFWNILLRQDLKDLLESPWIFSLAHYIYNNKIRDFFFIFLKNSFFRCFDYRGYRVFVLKSVASLINRLKILKFSNFW